MTHPNERQQNGRRITGGEPSAARRSRQVDAHVSHPLSAGKPYSAQHESFAGSLKYEIAAILSASAIVG
jgi:hypothetical protein